MRVTSLKGRLLLASLLILPLVLGITGATLDNAFKRSLDASERVRLERYFYLLFSLAELKTSPANIYTQQLTLPETLLEPDLEQPNSGVLAWVFDDKNKTIWRSNSTSLLAKAPESPLFSIEMQPGELRIVSKTWNKESYFFAHFDVLWQDQNNQDLPFRFALLHSKKSYLEALSTYQTHLWRGLGALAIFLLAAQTVTLYWALSPLRRMSLALKKMQQGDATALNESYPDELQQVSNSLTAVLEREAALRKRYRNSLSDLAHSLKTPLAVLTASPKNMKPEQYRQQTEEQVQRMNQVVSYQLQRAVSESQSGAQLQCNIANTTNKLMRSLEKIYQGKAVDIKNEIHNRLFFLGDEQDLLEILGNLLDNAYKYGVSKILITAVAADNNRIQLSIEDDGEGIAPALRSDILQRGTRLDTSKPGQGIGLTIVTDIINSYQGSLAITGSDFGGAKFNLILPGIKKGAD